MKDATAIYQILNAIFMQEHFNSYHAEIQTNMRPLQKPNNQLLFYGVRCGDEPWGPTNNART